MTSRRLLAVAVAALLTAACAGADSVASSTPSESPSSESPSSESPSSESPVFEPVPTIGLDPPLDPAPVEAAVDIEASAAEEIDTVVMIGDSITVASTAALEARFAALGLDEPVIVAQVSKRMAQAVRNNPSGAAIAEFLTADDEEGDGRANELWVVALGTNDIGLYRPEETAAAVNEVLANVPADAPLVWVDTYFRDEPEGETQLNSIIGDRLARRGNAVVAPWSFFAGGDGVLRSDGVHPSESGTVVFAAVVAETAARFLGR